MSDIDQQVNGYLKPFEELGKENYELKEKLRTVEAERDKCKCNMDDLSLCSINSDLCMTVFKLNEKLHALEKRLASAEKALGSFTIKINGYSQYKMLIDIKPLVIKHGGYQNAYTISNIIDGIEKAREHFKKYEGGNE